MKLKFWLLDLVVLTRRERGYRWELQRVTEFSSLRYAQFDEIKAEKVVLTFAVWWQPGQGRRGGVHSLQRFRVSDKSAAYRSE